MRKPLETKIESKFADYVRDAGALSIKLNIFGRRGWPDRLVLARGANIFFLEFKRPGKNHTEPKRKGEKLQVYIQKTLEEFGFHVFQTDSYEEAVDVFNRIVQPKEAPAASNQARVGEPSNRLLPRSWTR